MNNDRRIITKKEKYYFFLNPYIDSSFTRCPKCDNKTKIKKLPLAILLEKKKMIFIRNKTCKFCPYCKLIISKKHELDSIIMQFLGLNHITKDDYFVMGTQDKAVYREGLGKGLIKENPLEGVSVFKDVWNFGMCIASFHQNSLNKNIKLVARGCSLRERRAFSKDIKNFDRGQIGKHSLRSGCHRSHSTV